MTIFDDDREAEKRPKMMTITDDDSGGPGGGCIKDSEFIWGLLGNSF